MGKPDPSAVQPLIIRSAQQLRGPAPRPWICSLVLHAAAVIMLATLIAEPGKNRNSPLVILDTSDEPAFETPLELPDSVLPSFEMLPLPEAPHAAESPLPSSLLSPPLEISLPEIWQHSMLSDTATTSGASGEQTHPASDGQGDTIHSVVGDYSEALDQITRELIRLLKNGDVTVVWLFDQSTSMEDDREQIGQRFGRIYDELYASGFTKQDALTTGIASYSGEYQQHTANPTSVRRKIDSAIREVPLDPIGIERMSHAVLEAISHHRRYVQRTKRQFALIVVTDESGDPADNQRYLEEAIDAASQAKCHVYVLGREAMFGYPFQHTMQQSPGSVQIQTLAYDRGPETAYLQQLQIDGLGVRRDSILSGFGPYDQVRLTQATGGIFFMLPDEATTSSNLAHRRYRDSFLSAYHPDWRPRFTVVAAAKQDPLQVIMSQIIHNLNPLETPAARALQVRSTFAADIPTLSSQVRQEQAKMLAFAEALDQAIETLEQAQSLCDASPHIRRQADYQLMLAELLTYRIRAHEFHAYLAKFRQLLPQLPQQATAIPGWQVVITPQRTAPEKSLPEIDRARHLLEQIVQQRPGTPWATKAQAELDLGFGVALEPIR